MVLRIHGGGASLRLMLAIMGALVATAPHGAWSYGFHSISPADAHAQADAHMNGHGHGHGHGHSRADEHARELSSAHNHQAHSSFGLPNRAVNPQKQAGENWMGERE